MLLTRVGRILSEQPPSGPRGEVVALVESLSSLQVLISSCGLLTPSVLNSMPPLRQNRPKRWSTLLNVNGNSCIMDRSWRCKTCVRSGHYGASGHCSSSRDSSLAGHAEHLWSACHFLDRQREGVRVTLDCMQGQAASCLLSPQRMLPARIHQALHLQLIRGSGTVILHRTSWYSGAGTWSRSRMVVPKRRSCAQPRSSAAMVRCTSRPGSALPMRHTSQIKH